MVFSSLPGLHAPSLCDSSPSLWQAEMSPDTPWATRSQEVQSLLATPSRFPPFWSAAPLATLFFLFLKFLFIYLAIPGLWGHMGSFSVVSCGILQARILEWVVISFSRGSSWPRNQTWVSCIAGGIFTDWATREALIPWPEIKHRPPALGMRSLCHWTTREVLSLATLNSCLKLRSYHATQYSVLAWKIPWTEEHSRW